MALWQKVKILNARALGEVSSMYEANNIPIEVRDFCSMWIEASIKHLVAEAFVVGLNSQLNEKLQSLRDSSATPFYLLRRLIDFQNSLATVYIKCPDELVKRFSTCLEAEKILIRRSEEYVMMQVPQASPPCPPTTVTDMNMDAASTSQAGLVPLSPKQTDPRSPRASTSSAPSENFSRQQTIFLNNPLRIIIDSEMTKIFDAVWNLEEANNTFSFKCHELRRLTALRDSNRANNASTTSGSGQYQAYVEFQELESQANEATSEVLEMATIMWGKTNETRARTVTVLQNWAQLKSELDKDLAAWAQQQRLHSNGVPMQMTIADFQPISEYLMEVAWKLRCHLQKAEKIRETNSNVVADNTSNASASSGPTIPEHIATITSLIMNLAQDTFIIVHQPCQVVKTNTRFHVLPGRNPLEIRLLVGEKLSLQLTTPSVSVSLIDENTCRHIEGNTLVQDKFKKTVKKGRLLPDNARLDFSPDAKCSAVYRQISLKDFFRNGRKTTIGKEQAECVTEEKFCLLFRTEFSVGDLSFQLWRTSLPIVVTTHGSQDSLAWAAVTWDNAFCQPGRVPFLVPEHASWEAVKDMLNSRFTSMVGASLTEENMEYFADRLSFKPGFPDSISWSELCKVNLPDRKFTFWDWFFEGMRLIEQHLKDAWKDGFVTGFIGKETSESLLCNSGCQPGTFLFRFSESVIGGISIVWLHSDGKAYSLSPFKSKDLVTQPLVEKLNQETLHYVYPNQSKEVAFKKYYDEYKHGIKAEEATSPNKDRYVRFRNQIVIDNPNIPKFCLAEKPTHESKTYKILQPQQHLQQSGLSGMGQADEHLIEIDVDKILSFLPHEEPEESSPGSEYSQASPGNFVSNGYGHRGDREGPTITGLQEYSQTPAPGQGTFPMGPQNGGSVPGGNRDNSNYNLRRVSNKF